MDGLSSTIYGVQNQLDDHGALLKSHIVDLQTRNGILNKLVIVENS